MSESTRDLSRFKYAATLFGAMAILAIAPATAHADDDGPNPSGGGCTYVDTDGYEVPIDDGQDVFVDRETVSCRGEKIVVTTAPKRNVMRAPVDEGNPPVLGTTPTTAPDQFGGAGLIDPMK